MESYDDFHSALMARHQHIATRTLSTVGDALWLASVPAGVATRSIKVFLGVFAAGFVVATGAHLFQPGTVKNELIAVFRHPLWAAQAETARIRGGT